MFSIAQLELPDPNKAIEGGADSVILYILVAMFLCIVAAVIAIARWVAKRDSEHNETLKQLSSDNKTAVQSVAAEARAANSQLSTDHKAAISEISASMKGFAQVMAKQNAIQLARLPIEMQNEINRTHSDGG